MMPEQRAKYYMIFLIALAILLGTVQGASAGWTITQYPFVNATANTIDQTNGPISKAIDGVCVDNTYGFVGNGELGHGFWEINMTNLTNPEYRFNLTGFNWTDTNPSNFYITKFELACGNYSMRNPASPANTLGYANAKSTNNTIIFNNTNAASGYSTCQIRYLTAENFTGGTTSCQYIQFRYEISNGGANAVLGEIIPIGTWYNISIHGGGGGGGAPANLNVTIHINDSADFLSITNLTRVRIYNATLQMEVNTTSGKAVFENATNGTWTVNISSTDYFNFTFTNQALNISNYYRIYQSIVRFNITSALYGEVIPKANVSIQNSAVFFINLTMPTKAGNTNITLFQNTAGIYLNKSYTLHINKTTNVTINDYMWRSYANFTLPYMCNFTINLTLYNQTGVSLNYSYDTTNITGLTFNLMNGSYALLIDGGKCSSPYQVLQQNLTIALGQNQYNFTLFQTNTLNISFMEEVSDSNFVGGGGIYLAHLEAVSTLYTLNVSGTSTAQGLFIVAGLLQPGDYTLRYYVCRHLGSGVCYSTPGDTYPARNYYLNLTNGSVNSLNLYSGYCNQTAWNLSTTTYNQLRNTVDDVTIKVNRYSTVSGQYRMVGMMKSNLLGQAYFQCIYPNSDYYKFILERNGTTKLTTYPSQLFSQTMEFIIEEGVNLATNYFRSNTIDHRLYYNANAFTFTYNDLSNVARGGCVEVYKTNGLNDIFYNRSCANGVSGTSTVAIVENNGTIYKAAAYINYTDTKELYPVETAWKEYAELNPLGNVVPFMLAFMTMLFAAIGMWQPFVALILTPVPLVLSAYIGLINLPLSAAIGVWILCIMIAIYLETK